MKKCYWETSLGEDFGGVAASFWEMAFGKTSSRKISFLVGERGASPVVKFAQGGNGWEICFRENQRFSKERIKAQGLRGNMRPLGGEIPSHILHMRNPLGGDCFVWGIIYHPWGGKGPFGTGGECGLGKTLSFNMEKIEFTGIV